jgi:hypothetical protein
MFGRGILNGSNTSYFPRFHIKPKDGVCAGVLQPDLTVDFVMLRADLVDLNVIAVSSGGKLQVWNFSVFLSNFATPPWNCIPSQMFSSSSKRTGKTARREIGFEQRHFVIRDLA